MTFVTLNLAYFVDKLTIRINYLDERKEKPIQSLPIFITTLDEAYPI
jgi:hypothetical protein